MNDRSALLFTTVRASSRLAPDERPVVAGAGVIVGAGLVLSLFTGALLAFGGRSR